MLSWFLNDFFLLKWVYYIMYCTCGKYYVDGLLKKINFKIEVVLC